MKRQTGASLMSLLLALMLIGATLLVTVTTGAHRLRSRAQREDVIAAVTDVFTYVDYALADDWANTGCRALSEPPTLKELVNEYHAPGSILAYDIDIAYLSAPSHPISGTIALTVTLPPSLSGSQLSAAARGIADDIKVTRTTITLYRTISAITSPLQHRYFDGQTGCMQEEYS